MFNGCIYYNNINYNKNQFYETNCTSSLVITTATADMGPPMKRYRPRAQGRAFAIKKQTCHISIAVSANQSNKSEDSA